ncbi:fumarate hydratase [Methanobrevibacter sp. DSM 116169]|uniref:fumarate hydratase n=1 Tax=Methanobrevibacter sp. DSM 116169 TaxID=3242727 RepID=UPI0038FBED54
MNIKKKVEEAIIDASISQYDNNIDVFLDALEEEKKYNNENAVWALEMIIKNMKIAKDKKLPLCDDTGIPHVLIEIGNNRQITGEILSQINEGIEEGLKLLPGRPMAVKGNDIQRLEQSEGLYESPSMLKPANFIIDNGKIESSYKREIDEDTLNIHLALLGGGPEIRAKTHRVFHKNDYNNVIDGTINWLKDSLKLLGCTPAISSIGIGRTHIESSQLMLKGLIYGNLKNQSEIETYITNELNKTKIGPLGLGGCKTVLGTFVNIGPQRASGVRIVSSRPACFVEPRVATIKI